MSGRTLPQRSPLHSHVTAAIGSRLNLESARGDEHAKLTWLAVLSHTKWPGQPAGPTWANNATLAGETDLPVRHVARAVATLCEAEMLSTPYGIRPTAARKFGRLLVPSLGSRCKVLIPDRCDMANLWGLCRERRKRPAPMVTMMVGAYALASDHADRSGLRWDSPGRDWADWTPLGCTQAQWRRFVGARKNASWTARVRECESLDLIRRNGRAVEVAPARSWLRAQRAIESFVADRDRGPPLELPGAFEVVGAMGVARALAHDTSEQVGRVADRPVCPIVVGASGTLADFAKLPNSAHASRRSRRARRAVL